MTGDPTDGTDTDHEHRIGVVRGLLVSAIGAVRTRLDLAAVEAEIFLLRVIQMLLWALAGVACAVLALAFAMLALVAALWDTHRMLGVLSGVGVFVLLTLICGLLARHALRAHPHILEGTLQQLETDQQRVSHS